MKQMKHLIIVGTIAMLVAAGCSTIKYDTDYDEAADFSSFKTFKWAEFPVTVQDYLDRRVRRSVNASLALKGMVEQTDGSLMIAYHASSKDDVNTDTDWYGWGPYGPREPSSYYYEEGSLVISFVDVATNNLVWRGYASGVLDANMDPEELQHKVAEIVNNLMDRYPPKK